MGFGSTRRSTNRAQGSSFRINQLASLENARDTKDLACRLKNIMDGLMQDLNSQLGPIMGGFTPDGTFIGCISPDADMCAPEGDTPISELTDLVERNPCEWESTGGGRLHFRTSPDTCTETGIDQMAFSPGGRTVYIIDDTGGTDTLRVYDLPVPGNPDGTLVGSGGCINTSHPFHEHQDTAFNTNGIDTAQVSVDGRFLVFLQHNTDEIVVASSAGGLWKVGLDFTPTSSATVRDIVWDESKGVMYLAMGGDDSIWSIDIADVTTPDFLQRLTASGLKLDDAVGITLHRNKDTLYVARKGGVTVVDVSDPADMAVVNSYPISDFDDWGVGEPVTGVNVQGIAISNNVLFAHAAVGGTASDDGQWFLVFDIDSTDPETLSTRASAKNTSITNSSTHAGEGVSLMGNCYCFVTKHFSAGTLLVTVDVSDPDTPTFEQAENLWDGSSGYLYSFVKPGLLVVHPGGGRLDTYQPAEVSGGSQKTIVVDKIEQNNPDSPPMDVISQYLVENLNADQIDGLHVDEIVARAVRDALLSPVVAGGSARLVEPF